MQVKPNEVKADDEEINRAEAAQLLGVTSPTLRRFPIPYRQYMKRGHCYYRKADVLRFRQESMNKPTNPNEAISFIPTNRNANHD